MYINIKKTFILLSTAFTLSACTTSVPTGISPYVNAYPSPNDAHISFESSYKLHTHFSVNAEGTNDCKDFKYAGYILKKNAIFINERPNREIKITVPSKKLIGIYAYHQYNDEKYTGNCYADYGFFTPEANGEYIVKMQTFIPKSAFWENSDKSHCSISVEKINKRGKREKVTFKAARGCHKELQ